MQYLKIRGIPKNMVKNNDLWSYQSILKGWIFKKHRENNDCRSYQSIPKSEILQKHNENQCHLVVPEYSKKWDV